jgi:Protein of unknown function (DUF2934)
MNSLLKSIHKKNQIQVGIIDVGNWGKYGHILGLQFLHNANDLIRPLDANWVVVHKFASLASEVLSTGMRKTVNFCGQWKQPRTNQQKIKLNGEHMIKSKQHKTDNENSKSSPDPDLHEKIQKRAYEIWLADGSHHGNDADHWFQAETEVLSARRPS